MKKEIRLDLRFVQSCEMIGLTDWANPHWFTEFIFDILKRFETNGFNF